MTNAEKFQEIFKKFATEVWAFPEKDFLTWLNAEYNEPTTKNDLVPRNVVERIIKSPRTKEQMLLVLNSLPSQEPTTKNDLGVDCISRDEVCRYVAEFVNHEFSTREEEELIDNIITGIEHMPSVTPQEPKWIPVSEKKPNKGGEYLLWGKIDESEEEDYCFLGDYYEFEEVFGTEISNYDPKTLGFIDTEIEEYYSVVAWMPLPKPYKAESEDKE